MRGIKISFANQTKRISENIDTYDYLVQIIQKLFSFDKSSHLNDTPKKFNLIYIDKEHEEIQVASQEDYLAVCNYHVQNLQTAVMKLHLTVNYMKDSAFIDQMLDDVKMSESFAVLDKPEIYPVNSLPVNQDELKSNNNAKLINTDFDLKASAISKCLEKSEKEQVTNLYLPTGSHEKGVQMEIFFNFESKFTETEKIMTADVAENTPALEKQDGYAQYDLVEENCKQVKDLENKNIQVSTNINEEDYININYEKEKNINEKRTHKIYESANSQNILLSDKNFSIESDNLLFSRIEMMFASRLSQMESNIKIFLEPNQMSSKHYQHSEKFNHEDFSNEQKKFEIKEFENLKIHKDKTILSKVLPNPKLIEGDESKKQTITKVSNLIEDNGPTFFSLLEHKQNSVNNDENYHFSDYCSNCKYQILKNKYVCLVCNDFLLCSQCENLHLDHPLMKVNIKNKTITTKNELENFLRKQRKGSKEVKKKNFFKNFSKIFKQNECVINLQSKSSTIFAMGKGSKLDYTLAITSNTKLSEEVVVYAVNNKNFNVSPVCLNGLDSDETREFNIVLSAPIELGAFIFDICLTVKNKKIIFSPFKLEVIVVETDDVDESNANFMFFQYEEIIKLPKDKKVTLYNLIISQIVKKDFKDVLTILRKHKFDVDAALTDLIEDENPKVPIQNYSKRYYEYCDLQNY